MSSQNQQNVKELLTNAEKHLHRMFLIGAILGALSCFARADFNLPMYAFLYIMWDQDDVSIRFRSSSLNWKPARSWLDASNCFTFDRTTSLNWCFFWRSLSSEISSGSSTGCPTGGPMKVPSCNQACTTSSSSVHSATSSSSSLCWALSQLWRPMTWRMLRPTFSRRLKNDREDNEIFKIKAFLNDYLRNRRSLQFSLKSVNLHLVS